MTGGGGVVGGVRADERALKRAHPGQVL